MNQPRLAIDTIVLLILFGFIAGALAGIGLVALFKPNCPTEDSCVVDYRDGEWHIEEVTP